MNNINVKDLRGETEFPLSEVVKVGYNSYIPGWKIKRIGKTSTMYYVISGKMCFVLNGKEYAVDEGGLFFLSLDEVAVIKNPSAIEKCSLYYITFRFKDGIDFHHFDIDRPIVDKEKKLFNHIRQLYKTHLAEGAAYKLKEFSEFSMLMYELFTYKLNNDRDRRVDMKLAKAVQYLKMNYYKQISIAELSKISGYSPSHLRRLFVAGYGVPPQEYLTDIKIRKAMELLTGEEDKTVEEVAELIGMCDTSYFCKMFKRKTGISPLGYKKGRRE